MKILTMNEQILLLAILQLKDNAYGVTIRNHVIRVTGKNMVYGTLYNGLDKLVKKGYVITREGEPTPERGGRRKIYYTVTSEALDALQITRSIQSAIWQDFNPLLDGDDK